MNRLVILTAAALAWAQHAPAEVLVLQQGVSPPGYAGCADTTLVKGGGKAARLTGAEPALALAGTANRLLLRFELPATLKGKRIDSAELQLFLPHIKGFKTTHVEFTCSRVLEEWTDRADWTGNGKGGIWTVPGGTCETETDFHNGRPKGAMDSETFFAPPATYWVPPTWLPAYLPEGGRWVTFDVTPAVEGWLKGSAPNRGLCVSGIRVPDKRFKNTATSAVPSADYAKDKSLRPKLVLRLAGTGSGCRLAMLSPLRRYSALSPRFRYRGGEVNEYTLKLARHEYEAFQVWVKPEREDLKRFRFEWADLLDPASGRRIGKENLRCFRQPHVRIKHNYRVDDFYFRGKLYRLPDPLLPAKPADLKRGRAETFWFTLYAPPDTPPGTYHTTLRAVAEGAAARQLKLTARVWNYAIPKDWTFRTMGQMIWEEVARFYGKLTPQIRRNYIDFLLDHRFAPTEQYRSKLSPDAADIPHCAERGGNIIYLAGSWRGNVEALKAPYEKVRKLGLLHQALVYIGDESSDYQKMIQRARAVHASFPGAAAMIGGSKPRPELIGHIDIWDVQLNRNKTYGYGAEDAKDPAAVRRTIRQALDRGEDFYFYDGTDPPRPDTLMGGIEGPSMGARIMLWTAWKYGFNGYELYCYNQWKKNTRGLGGKKWPEVPWDSHSWRNLNGSGMMFYPGPAGRPASSIRLELATDGIEDWESLLVLSDCLAALKATNAKGHAGLGERARAILAVPDEVVKDFRTWTHEPAVLTALRDEVSGMIEKLMGIVGEAGYRRAAAARRTARRRLTEQMLQARHAAAGKAAAAPGPTPARKEKVP